MVLIEARGLRVAGRLDDVSVDLRPGELLGIIGPNGAGKSTLLQCLAGITEHRGTLLLDGQPAAALAARARARFAAYLPQASASAWALRARDVIALGRLPWGDENESAIREAARQAGAQALLERRIDQLSGGERARVWLARVLAGQPRALLADEPIASLDLPYQRAVMDTLRARARGDRGVAVSLHDLGLAARYCDRVCLLSHGAVLAFGAPGEVLTEALLSAAFQTPISVNLVSNPPLIALK